MPRFCGYGRAAALFVLTVLLLSCGGSSSSSVSSSRPASWRLVATPAGATAISFFAADASNDWYIADLQSGFWKSTDQGGTWTQINSAIFPNLHGRTIQYDSATGALIASIYNPNYPSAGPVHFYISTDKGATWSQMTEPSGFFLSSAPATTGCEISAGASKITLCGGFFGPAGDTGMYSSSSAFNSTALISQGVNSSIYSFKYNPTTQRYLMGTETQGLWQASDGHTFTAISPDSSTIRVGNILGITYASDGTPIFAAQGGVWKCDQTTSCQNPTNVLSNGNTSAGSGLYRDSLGSIYEGHRYDSLNPIIIYRSTDQGATWQEWDTGIANSNGVTADEFLENSSDGKIYAVIQNEVTKTGYIYRSPK